ncbi:glycosyltransferase family 4 protein [Mycobacterium kansasii]|uniref:Glycosyl transferases group 1 family protein n=3 Tax=Mycobacterium kansasii TaxID=1768 RepID=A0A1V3XM95_MYCKA|nr:glycosyltransferase family 4 protein [Mycobacterium kansasii]EUA02053.1 glycosyl transferases group 1 family protein [Mycobacterium kansasii 824]AGZ50362.1 glycosyl transferase [Mycobacterium kansasii ATCC 12478]EUA17644.1 glycosyl transferases group 1 family protein [Mycobacterium kansasii 662]KEP39664.1 glycosyl transferase [Mycobacterium kansasii]OOK80309.1 glycosyl transferases group 1 family protein [Mycobacterium kansasii]
MNWAEEISVPDPLRVLVVGPAPIAADSRGGMAAVIALMAAHPDERIRITVVPTFVDEPRWRRLWVGVQGMVRATWLVLRGHTDVLHVHLAHGGSVIRKALPLWAARLTGIPTVVHAHSYDFGGWFDRLPPLVRAAVRRMLAADCWLVLGERHVAEYASRLRLADSRIGLLHNAVRIPDTPVTQFGAEPVHAVSLGRLGARKGSYDVIAAVASLDATVRRRLRVTLAGDGEVHEVRAAVSSAGMGATIRVAGWLDSAARDELLSSAHIFVLPSYNEGLPVALLEAMAYGLAPVTTMVGSMGEVVSDRVDGLIVGPGCPGEIAEALSALVTDEQLRAHLGSAARERASDFGLDRWYQQLTQLWTRLASTPAALSR